VRPGGGKLRPLGFGLLMLGFGLRLDTGWQHLAWILLAVGTTFGVSGLAALARDRTREASFVPPGAGG
jgi:hypothetical protein